MNIKQLPPEDLEEEEEEDRYCHHCAGTGEGQYDGAVCSRCHGKGVLPLEQDPEDFPEPDPEDFAPWDGPL